MYKRQPLVLFTKNYLKDHPDINYFIYGHRHIMLDLMLSRTSRMLILGDWLQAVSYTHLDVYKRQEISKLIRYGKDSEYFRNSPYFGFYRI